MISYKDMMEDHEHFYFSGYKNDHSMFDGKTAEEIKQKKQLIFGENRPEML